LVPAVFDPLASQVIDAIQPQPATRVLDVACGTGILARRLASAIGPTGNVTGLDLSPAMIDIARNAAEREALSIDWHVGRAESLPFPDGSFDIVTCQQGLQFASDKAAAASELCRVLTDGASVAVCVWQALDKHPVYAALHAAVQHVLNTPVMATPFSLGEPELRRLLNDAGFVDVVITPVTITASFPDAERYVELQIEGASAALPQLQQLGAAGRSEVIAGIRAEMEEQIRDRTVDGGLRFPLHAHLAQAHRPGSDDSRAPSSA